jgi:WD40 repeat protein
LDESVEAPRSRIDEQNPWPGLAAFDESAQRFFNGRRNETAELRSLVLHAPLTVVFGASGLGKTSLLQAGLFPWLRKDNVLPVYVRLDVRDRMAPLIEQVKHALLEQFDLQQVDAPAFADAETLWEWLHRDRLEVWSQRNQLLTPLFVLDQFEEVFTLGAENSEAVARLRVDLADLIENRVPTALAMRIRAGEASDSDLSLSSQRYKVLISFREDFLPAVEGWKRDLPSIMRNRLRLLPMSGEQAFEAVHTTAPHLADEAIARAIVRFVAGVQAEGMSGSPSHAGNETDLAVEPALLSLVCHGLNKRRKAQGKSTFDRALLQETGPAIVSDFYQNAVGDLPEGVQRFIEEELITERGFRKPYDIDDARTVHNVTDQQLRLLVDRRLLRIEPYRGTERVELTHDLLTPVVRKHRDRQREEERRQREKESRRRQRRWSAFLSAIGLGAFVSALVMFGLYRDARAAANLAQQRLATSAFREATVRVSQNDATGALAFLARALRSWPDHAGARALVTDLLLNRSWARTVVMHDSSVATVAWSPDGMRVLTGSYDHTARVWDASTGEQIGALPHQDWVVAVAWSPDTARVVTGAYDSLARIWDVRTGEQAGAPLEHGGPVWAVAWSPNGTRVLTGSNDMMARVWDAGTGKQIGKPLRHRGAVWAVAWSPDSMRVLTGSYDNTARVWDASTGEQIGEPLRHRGPVSAVAWSPDGTQVLTGSHDSQARIWDVGTGEQAGAPLEHGGPVRAVAWSPDGTRVLTGSDDRTARVWDATTGRQIGTPLEHHDRVWAVAWSPDTARVVTGSEDTRVRVWDAPTLQPVGVPLIHQRPVWAVAWSPDTARVVTGAYDSQARIWDVRTGEQAGAPLEHGGPVWAVAWSPNGTRVLTGSEDSTARVWDAGTRQQIGEPLRHRGPVWAVAWSADSTFLTGSLDSTARVWDARTLQPMGDTLEHQGAVWAVAWSRDGTRVLTGSGDSKAHVRDASTGRHVGETREHQGWVRAVAWSPDSMRLLTGSEDGTARVWDAHTLQPVGDPMKHGGAVWAVAWSPDGTRILTGAEDRKARMWDARTLQPVGAALEHQGAVWAVAWSPDGTQVLTGSHDNTARRWDAPVVQPDEAVDAANFAELIGGLRVSDDDALVPIDAAVRRARLEERKQRAMSRSAPAGSLDTLLKWFFSDPRERTISPLSTMSIDEYVTRMLALGESGRAEVARTYPGHPRLRELLISVDTAVTSAQPR